MSGYYPNVMSLQTHARQEAAATRTRHSDAKMKAPNTASLRRIGEGCSSGALGGLQLTAIPTGPVATATR